MPKDKGPDLWYHNDIQFPRLIAEMEAAGFFQNDVRMAALCSSMDLEVADVMGLVDRAQRLWDEQKARNT